MKTSDRVIALGFFDGMHIGHSALLTRVIEISGKTGFVPSVITFDTHPMSFISGNSLPLITSYEDRIGLIRRMYGIDDVILLRFDKQTAEMPWDAFIDYLLSEFGARHLVAGYDFRFGSGGQGAPDRLVKKCAESGIGCDIIPEVRYNGVTVSSTQIRELIANGELDLANKLLGHPHVLTGTVLSGIRLGRTLGVPTINMRFEDGVVVPSFGVYAARVCIGSDSFVGVSNIGVRPTVDNSGQITAETHILDYSGDLYGQKVLIEFHKYLRPEVKFSELDELSAQIRRDSINAQQYFERLSAPDFLHISGNLCVSGD